MKIHYAGKYDGNPDSLPHKEHHPHAVPFKEIQDMKTLSIVVNIASFAIMAALVVPMIVFQFSYHGAGLWVSSLCLGAAASMATLFPHEFLHAVCFREDSYIYTNWKQGLLFAVGTESMSKGRFIVMSMLPNLIFGFLPYLLSYFLISPFLGMFGAVCISMGAGDYYNVFHALTQMPKGSMTYLYGFHSYWYLPDSKER